MCVIASASRGLNLGRWPPPTAEVSHGTRPGDPEARAAAAGGPEPMRRARTPQGPRTRSCGGRHPHRPVIDLTALVALALARCRALSAPPPGPHRRWTQAGSCRFHASRHTRGTTLGRMRAPAKARVYICLRCDRSFTSFPATQGLKPTLTSLACSSISRP
eukprot:6593243-Prymnesium_polylepis.1